MEPGILDLIAKFKADLKAYSESKDIDSDKEGEFYAWQSTLNTMEKYFKNKLKNKSRDIDETEFTYKGKIYRAVEYTEEKRGLGSPCLYCCFYRVNEQTTSNRCIKRMGENIPPCSAAFRKDKKTVFFLPSL